MRLAKVTLKESISERTLKHHLNICASGSHQIVTGNGLTEVFFDHPEDAYAFVTKSRSLVADVKHQW